MIELLFCFLLLLVSSSCCQPSIYLRLLENPSAVAEQTTFLYSPKSPPLSRSPSPSRSKSPFSPPRSPSPNFSTRCYPERTSPDLTTQHFSASSLTASDHDHSSERSETSAQQVNFMPLSSNIFHYEAHWLKTPFSRSVLIPTTSRCLCRDCLPESFPGGV